MNRLSLIIFILLFLVVGYVAYLSKLAIEENRSNRRQLQDLTASVAGELGKSRQGRANPVLEQFAWKKFQDIEKLMTQKLHGAESYQIAVSLLTEGQAILAELKAGSSSSGHGPADALVYLLQAEALLQNSVKALEPEKAARHETGAVQSALAAVSRTYKVSRGDTLWGISKKLYKTPWRWNDIWKLNSAKIPVYKRMSSGTVLKLPG